MPRRYLAVRSLLFLTIGWMLGGGPALAQLTGTLTINNTGSGPADYTTFAAAINDLVANGANGDVIYEVKGNYSELIVIPAFPLGPLFNTATNVIVFRGEGADLNATGGISPNDNTILSSPSTLTGSVPFILIDGATNVTFEDVFARHPSAFGGPVFEVRSNAPGFRLNRVKTFGIGEGVLVNQQDANDIVLENGTFLGQRAVSITGSAGGVGLTIRNNLAITGGSTDILFASKYSNVNIYGNTITDGAITQQTGIHLKDMGPAIQVYNNKLSARWGIHVEGSLPAGATGYVVNNMLEVAERGVVLENAGRYRVLYNSIRVAEFDFGACSTSGSTTTRGISVEGATSTDLFVRNNVFANVGGGYSVYVDSSTPASALDSDGNNVFALGDQRLHFRGTDYADLAAFRADAATGTREANSFVCNPQFAFTDPSNPQLIDLHSTAKCMDGTALTGFAIPTIVNTDIDGDARAALNGPADVGADEFTSTTGLPLAAGTYTVGGGTSNFATLAAALNALYERGVQGAVTFDIAAGNHDLPTRPFGSFFFYPVDGTNSTFTVTLKGQASETTPTAVNQTVRTCGRLNMTFDHIDRTASTNSFFLGNNTSNLTIQNGTFGTSNSKQVTHVETPLSETATPKISDVTIKDNVFLGDYLNGINIHYGEDITIQRNAFTHANPDYPNFNTQAVSVDGFGLFPVSTGVQLIGNSVAGPSRGFSGSFGSASVITANTIRTFDEALIVGMTGSVGQRGLISNNMLHTTEQFGSPVVDLMLEQADFIHNTVFSSGTTMGAGLTGPNWNAAMRLNQATDAQVINNIFIHDGSTGEAATFVELSEATFISDDNLFYKPVSNTNLLTWIVPGGASQSFTDLASFRAAAVTGSHEANSVSVSVVFASPTDLRLAGASIGNQSLAVNPVAAVPTDFDGGTRPTPTYMGADDPTVMLPVELTRFSAQLDGNDVHLHWSTATETNNAGFEIQMQRTLGDEARATWTTLDFVNGQGTTLATQTYRYTVASAQPGVYRFRLKQIDYDGTFAYSPEVEVAVELAETYVLSAAYPNPFNPQTQFSLQVAHRQEVEIAAYDVMGRRVAVLHSGRLTGQQQHTFTFDAANLANGLYLIRVTGERFTETQQVMLVK